MTRPTPWSEILYLGNFDDYPGDEPFFIFRFADPVGEADQSSVEEQLMSVEDWENATYALMLDETRWTDDRTLEAGTTIGCFAEDERASGQLMEHFERVIRDLHSEHPIVAVLFRNGLPAEQLALTGEQLLNRFGRDPGSFVPWVERWRSFEARRAVREYIAAARPYTDTALDGLQPLWRHDVGRGRFHFLCRLRGGNFGLLTRLKNRWRWFEGDRDSVLATVPGELFEDASRACSGD
jgi:hypothetical protein